MNIPKPNFDFENPEPSFAKEYKLLNDKAQEFLTDCVNTKIEQIKKLDPSTRLGWAYKALLNSAANYMVVSTIILTPLIEDSESIFEILNMAHSTLTAQYIVPLLSLLVQQKLDKSKIAEVELLKKMMEMN